VLGTGRLFDNNEGPNVKLSFDGFRLIAVGSRARLDLFAINPLENNPGFFEDVRIMRKAYGEVISRFQPQL
jgi:hypothetical protein